MALPSERLRIADDDRTSSLLDAPDQNYDYPNDLDLRPGSPFHDDLVKELLYLARESADTMALRHEAMETMEDCMRAFIPTSAKEDLEKARDSRKPIPIVVPVTYALCDSLETQIFSAYSSDEQIHYYRGSGPEDAVGAMLGEKIVQLQTQYFNEVAATATQIRDELTYGFGVVSPQWVRDVGYRSVQTPKTFIDPITGMTMMDPSGAMEEGVEEDVLFEGNRVFNIDPFCYLPDPNVPIHQPQDGEYVGWKASFNSRNRLVEIEAGDQYSQTNPDGTYFNCKYLKYLQRNLGRSTIYPNNRRAGQGIATTANQSTRIEPIDVVYLYVRLVPYEWALSPRTVPEKWMFAVAGDTVIIAARPMGLRHNKFPVAVCAADSDGYDNAPLSRLETSYGLQHAINFIWNAKMAFAKRALLGSFLIKGEYLEPKDVMNPGPSRFIRATRLAPEAPLDQIMKQLDVQDPNPSALQDIMALYDWMQRATGSTDTLMGIMRNSGERRSADESRGARQNAMSRVDRLVKLRNAQGMNDLARMLFAQTAQLLSQPMYVRAVGRWEEELRAEYGYQTDPVTGGPMMDPATGQPVANPQFPYVEVDPRKLDVAVDVVPGDSVNKGKDFFQDWITLYGMIINNPALVGQVDFVRVFKHIARLGGASNVSDFMVKNPQMQGQVMPADQIQQGVAAGNLVPATEGAPYGPNRFGELPR